MPMYWLQQPPNYYYDQNRKVQPNRNTKHLFLYLYFTFCILIMLFSWKTLWAHNSHSFTFKHCILVVRTQWNSTEFNKNMVTESPHVYQFYVLFCLFNNKMYTFFDLFIAYQKLGHCFDNNNVNYFMAFFHQSEMFIKPVITA